MYAVKFNNPEEATWQTRHSYEEEFGYLWGLSAQNDFPSIFPKNWWYCF